MCANLHTFTSFHCWNNQYKGIFWTYFFFVCLFRIAVVFCNLWGFVIQKMFSWLFSLLVKSQVPFLLHSCSMTLLIDALSLEETWWSALFILAIDLLFLYILLIAIVKNRHESFYWLLFPSSESSRWAWREAAAGGLKGSINPASWLGCKSEPSVRSMQQLLSSSYHNLISAPKLPPAPAAALSLKVCPPLSALSCDCLLVKEHTFGY